MLEADVVFRGTMTQRIDPPVGISLETYKFDVQEVLKGDPQEVIILSGYLSDCTYFFKQGHEYLVYAHWGEVEGERTLNTGICSATSEVVDRRRTMDGELKNYHQPG